MLARLACTALSLLLAAGNFFGGVLLPPGPLNPFGVVFLALAGVFWFGWEMIQDSYAYQEERRRAGHKIPDPLLVRFAPALGAMSPERKGHLSARLRGASGRNGGSRRSRNRGGSTQ
jgi:hypothetical protein